MSKTISFEEFKTLYKPIRQSKKRGIQGYLLTLDDTTDAIHPIDQKITTQGKVNRWRMSLNYEMYTWTLLNSGRLVSGKEYIDVKGYIFCESCFDIIEKLVVNINSLINPIKMKFSKYKECTLRTLKITEPQIDLAHMALGLNSELGELTECLSIAGGKTVDLINLGEELGDMMWYISNYINIRNITIDDEDFAKALISKPWLEKGISHLTTLLTSLGQINDYAKRYLAYGQEIEKQKTYDKEYETVCTILSLVNDLAEFHGLNIEIIMGKNIAKLYVRYPENFSSDHALVRDLEKEREALA